MTCSLLSAVVGISAYQLGLIPYFPLVSGLLTGKYCHDAPMPEDSRLACVGQLANRYLTEANSAIIDRLLRRALRRASIYLRLRRKARGSRP